MKIKRAVQRWLWNPLTELGEFSLSYGIVSERTESLDEDYQDGQRGGADDLNDNTQHDEVQEEQPTDSEHLEEECEQNMARTASKEKVSTVQVATVKVMTDWAQKLSYNGFQADSFQFNGDGDIVSATCTKNGKVQIITPELFEAVVVIKT